MGGLGISLLNNCDTVEIACLAQLINVIAPITTVKGGGVFKQTTFYPYELLSHYGRGTAMKAVVEAPSYQTIYGECKLVEPAIIYDEIHVFVLNAEESEETELTLELAGLWRPEGRKAPCILW